MKTSALQTLNGVDKYLNLFFFRFLMIRSPSLKKSIGIVSVPAILSPCCYLISDRNTIPLFLFLGAFDWLLHLIIAMIIRRAADVASRRRFRLLLTRQESLVAAIKAASSSCDLPPFLLVSSRSLPATAFSFRYPPPPRTSTCSCFFSLVNTHGTCRRFIFKTGAEALSRYS